MEEIQILHKLGSAFVQGKSGISKKKKREKKAVKDRSLRNTLEIPLRYASFWKLVVVRIFINSGHKMEKN